MYHFWVSRTKAESLSVTFPRSMLNSTLTCYFFWVKTSRPDFLSHFFAVRCSTSKTRTLCFFFWEGWSPTLSWSVMRCTWPPSRNHIFQVPPSEERQPAISAQGWLRSKWSWGQEVYWGIKSIQGILPSVQRIFLRMDLQDVNLPSRWKSCYIRKEGESLRRQRTYPLNNGGWKMTFSFWNGPFSGDILTFNKRLREYRTQKDISPFVYWPLLLNFRGGGGVLVLWLIEGMSS